MPSIPEHELIQRYFAPLAGPEGLQLADDAAALSPETGVDWIVSTDMILEGVHFLEDPPDAIGAKALRVNLSDLAAKGSEPFAYSLAIGLGDDCDERWVARFADGLASDQKRYGVYLIGGDTNRSPAGSVVAITAFGRLPAGEMVRRSGAEPGDAVLVSGTIGDAALGLMIRMGQHVPLRAAEAGQLLGRLQRPEPRIGLAPLLRRFATAAIDVSDGLAGDVAKLCSASGVGATVEAARVPLSEAARAALGADSGLRESILTGGDDYEILFTVREENAGAMISEAREIGIDVTPIGRVVELADGLDFTDREGNSLELPRRSYDHFSGPVSS